MGIELLINAHGTLIGEVVLESCRGKVLDAGKIYRVGTFRKCWQLEGPEVERAFGAFMQRSSNHILDGRSRPLLTVSEIDDDSKARRATQANA